MRTHSDPIPPVTRRGARRPTALLLSLVLGFALGPSPSPGSELAADLDARLAGWRDRGFSGVVLVRAGGSTVLHRGYGLARRSPEIPNRPGTVFPVASLAKLLTATMVLQLVEEGKLSPDDTIDRFLGSRVPEAKREITVHHLLTHTSGLPRYHDSRGDFERMSRDGALSAILGADLAAAPGAECSYSNAGYTLLALVIEKVTGREFPDYQVERIIDPAGMERTGYFRDRRWTTATTAVGYVNGRARGSAATFPGTWWALWGNAGLVSTAADLARFVEALADGTLLGPESLATMRRHYAVFDEEDGVFQAHGFRVRTTPRGTTEMLHGGGTDFGLSAYLRWFPDEDALVIVQSNATIAGRSPVVKVSDDVVAGLFGEAESGPLHPQAPTTSRDDTR